ncbi:MAG: hypothetical protein ABSF95_10010 [Verrucomicrobiota bacterium]|jgi:hypothetical protein
MKSVPGLQPLLALALLAAPGAAGAEGSAWEHSIVTLEVARKQYDYYQPWSKGLRRLQKAGLVVGEREVLTTADELFERTLVRLQKGGRGQWWMGQAAWIDYHANLALVTTAEADFWRDLKPATLGSAAPSQGAMQILRWREGNLENRRAEFTQFSVREGQLSPLNHVVLEVSSDIQGVGWGEPVVVNAQVAGLLTAQEGRNCYALPASSIRAILQARRQGAYPGLGYFHFYWQPAKNTASLAWLGLTGEPRGVMVVHVPDRPDGRDQVLKPKDILLNIDGFDLDIQGDYNDPEFGHLNLEALATRGKWAGQDLKMQLWREGKPMAVSYCLPKFEYTNALVPYAVHDQEPEYLLLGGLVFQPLTDSYLQSWGAEWKRNAPFRLYYYNSEEPTKERPALVLLSHVLPDAYNIGYQDQKYLVLHKVNGQPVSRLPELRDALQKPLNGYHILEFVHSDSLRRMVLAAGQAEREATARVLEHYGIDQAFRFATPAAGK